MPGRGGWSHTQGGYSRRREQTHLGKFYVLVTAIHYTLGISTVYLKQCSLDTEVWKSALEEQSVQSRHTGGYQ